jgi:hypothetical protein
MFKTYFTVEYGKYTDYLKEWEKEIQNGVGYPLHIMYYEDMKIVGLQILFYISKSKYFQTYLSYIKRMIIQGYLNKSLTKVINNLYLTIIEHCKILT